MWTQISLPAQFCERIWGFSIPIDDTLVVISSEGVHTIDLKNPGKVSHDYTHPEGRGVYDDRKDILQYGGRQFKVLGGELGGSTQPILESTSGEQIWFNHAQQFFVIKQKNGETALEYHFKDFSGDWGEITFSEDEKYIVLGMPYDLYVFKRE